MTEDTATPGLRAAYDNEVLVPYTIALLSFCLCSGLLLSLSIVRMPWLPGQFALLVVLCYLVPLSAVFSRRYQSGLDGLAAREYGRRALLLRATALFLILVGVPWLEWTHQARGDWMNWTFGLPVLTAVATASLAWTHASSVFDRWASLHPQPWEDGASDAPLRPRGFDQESGGRVNRTREVRVLWRDFARWGVVLSLALFTATTWSFGGTQLSPVTAGLLIGSYAVTGTLLIGRSALLRLATEWRLDRLTISGNVGQAWVPTTAAMTTGAVTLIVLLLVAHVLDAIHNLALALWDGVLGPALIAGVSLIARLFGGSSQQQISGMMHTIGTFGHAAPARISPHPVSHNHVPWLDLLAVVAAAAVLLIVRAYLTYRKTREPGQPWWRIFPAILAELRALLRALRGPTGALLGRAALRATAVAAAVEARRGHAPPRDGELDPRGRIVYFYGKVLAAAARLGQPRRPGQSPGEFAGELGARLGPGRDAFDELTAAFAEARYSPHEVRKDRADRARSNWTTVRASIKAARRRPPR